MFLCFEALIWFVCTVEEDRSDDLIETGCSALSSMDRKHPAQPLEFRLGHGELGLEKTLSSGTWLLL
jgi:hypothetical protein